MMLQDNSELMEVENDFTTNDFDPEMEQDTIYDSDQFDEEFFDYDEI